MKGDFTGFSFDGIHTSELGIVHVSDGDRYNEDLFPEFRDKSIEIPANHGDYYYGSTYGVRHFDVKIAFDSVTEEQFRKIRTLFSSRKNCELIFDERPYKVYTAKVENPIQLSYVCFDEPKRHAATSASEGLRTINRDSEPTKEPIYPWVYEEGTQRIYKGEGDISFVCYFPFAKQLFKIKELYESGTSGQFTYYDNVDEWIESSGILDQNTYNGYNIDQVIYSANNTSTYTIPVYNPGDLNVGFCLYIPFTDGKILPKDNTNYIYIEADDKYLLLDEITQKNENETGIVINTDTHLIEGVIFSNILSESDYRHAAWQKTGTLYNEFIKSGEFPRIKRNDWQLDDTHLPQGVHIACSDVQEETNENGGIRIFYDYLYF